MRFISCHDIYCDLGLSLSDHFFSVLKVFNLDMDRLRIRILSARADSISHSFNALTRERYYQYEKIKFVSPRSYVISSIY